MKKFILNGGDAMSLLISPEAYHPKRLKERKHDYYMGFVLPNFVSKLEDSILVKGFDNTLLVEHRKAKLSFKEAAKKLKTTPASYAHYLHGRTSCSIKMLRKLENLYRSSLFEKVFEGNFVFSARKKPITLPRVMTTELAYYIGYLQGDGYIGSDRKRFGFTDEYLAQMEKLNEITYKLFKKEGKIIKVISRLSKKPSYKLEIKSVVLTRS